MRLVAVDSSARGRIIVAALALDGRETAWRGRVLHDVAIETALPGLLVELAGDGADVVVAVTGPGSRTGVRAGVAAALGLARARGAPLHGAGALEVVARALLARSAHPLGGDVLWGLADAGRGGLYAAPFGDAGGGLDQLAPAERLGAAGWRVPEGATAALLEEMPLRPPGVAVVGSDDAAIAGLALTALAAQRRPALDAAALGGLDSGG